MLDQFHDLFLQMAPHQFAKIQVSITTLAIHGEDNQDTSSDSNNGNGSLSEGGLCGKQDASSTYYIGSGKGC